MVQPVNNHTFFSGEVQLSCAGTIILISSIVLILFGILSLSHVQTFSKGIFFSNVTLGPTIEGSLCLIIGTVAMSFILALAYSSRVRESAYFNLQNF